MAPVKIRRDEYEEKYYIPKQWMYGQIIGKKGRTLEQIKERSGLHHIYMDINHGYCLLVGDQKSIKRGKEVINELLNLQSPAQTDTAAAAQPKNAPTKTKTPVPTPKTKKLPPLPSEPKPVVSNETSDEKEEESTHENEENQDPKDKFDENIPALSPSNFPSVRATSKESPLSRKTPTAPPTSSKKKKKKGRKQSTSSEKSEKERKTVPSTPPAPPVSTSCSSLSTQGTQAEQTLDTDFLKTSQNLQLGEFRKSLEHFTNLADGPSSVTPDSPTISDGLPFSGKTFDHDLYNSLSSNIYGTLSSLKIGLISGLKVLDDKPSEKKESEESDEKPEHDENNNETNKCDENEKTDENNEVKKLKEKINSLNNENSFLRDQLKLYQTCRICKDLLEWNEERVALSCGHIFCSACANKFWKERRCRVCEQRPSGFSYIAMFT